MYGGGRSGQETSRIPLPLAILIVLGGVLVAVGAPAMVLYYPAGPGAWSFLWLWEAITVAVSIVLVVALVFIIKKTNWLSDARKRIGAWVMVGFVSVVCLGTVLTVWSLTPKTPEAISAQGTAKPKPAASNDKTNPSDKPSQTKTDGKSGDKVATSKSDKASDSADKPTDSAPKMPPEKPQAEMLPGEKIVNDKCLSCHRYKGFGFGSTDNIDKAIGKYTMSWFIQLLRDPVNVGKKFMPPQNLTDQEIYDVARFLAGRGGNPGQEKEWFGNQTLQQSDAQLIETGKNAYDRFNCESCHKIGNVGGTNGPELTAEGQKRTREWLETFFVDYFVKFPAMPFLPLSPDDIRGLSAYLASLK